MLKETLSIKDNRTGLSHEIPFVHPRCSPCYLPFRARWVGWPVAGDDYRSGAVDCEAEVGLHRCGVVQTGIRPCHGDTAFW